MMLRRRSALTGLAAWTAGVMTAGTAWADAGYPVRPVRLVVPYAAGGGTDIMARLIATEMGRVLGQPVVVDNRAGAGGSLGADSVAKSAADGYTILMGTASTHAINPVVNPKLGYDAVKSFTPLSLVASIPGVVVVNSKSPYRTLTELVAAMRQNPGKLTFGSQGLGGLSHMMGEMLNAQAQLQSVHVPYRGGAAALQDVLAGNVDILYDTLPVVLPHLKSGALRALAVTARERSAVAPEVPTTLEQGQPQFVAHTWNALFAPAQLPPAVAAKLTAAAQQAVRHPDVQARIRAMSAEPVGSDGAALAARVQQELQSWSKLAQSAQIRLD